MRVLFFISNNEGGGFFRGREMARNLEEKNVKTIVYNRTSSKNKFEKFSMIPFNFLKRLRQVLKSKKEDIIYIQKIVLEELFVYWIAKKIFNKKVVFDFDDSIFLVRPWRVKKMVQLSDKVIVGSHYLKDYAKKHNKNTYLIPTSVDTDIFKPKEKTNREDKKIILGWAGSSSTSFYLNLLVKPLEKLGKKYEIELRIYGLNKEQSPKFKNINVSYHSKWLKPKELSKEIQKFDIGLMPLYNTEWEKGKCAYKMLVYMACGLPSVSSNVGETNYIIKDGKNGFLCGGESKEWEKKLKKLINSPRLRKSMGKEGRKTIEEKYSLDKNAEKLKEILK